MVKVSVKWQKQTFSDLEIDFSQPPIVFKGQIFTLTGVKPERQKIMVKGGLLQDDGDWKKMGIKEGQKLMMMGTTDDIHEAASASSSETAPVFVEDLPEEEQEGASLGLSSAGLVNLGNTCYMNSTVQCLHSIPPLKQALAKYLSSSGIPQDASHLLTLCTKELFGNLETSKKPIAPFSFLSALREKFPQFRQQNNQGEYMQQDAEECWTQILFTLSMRLRDPENPSTATVRDLFEIEFVNKLACSESEESSTERGENALMLKCHISAQVNRMEEGIAEGLKGEIEKNSATLNRSAIFKKQSFIQRLPKLLTVQFVRFFWKRESQQKAKILRKVTFPVSFDAFDFCSEELKEKLEKPRNVLRLQRESEEAKEGERKLREKGNKGKAEGEVASKSAENSVQDSTMTDAEKVESPESAKQECMTGFFDLQAVLTHKGRSADSGHYEAWVKQDDGSWVEFDDDSIVLRKEQEILNLNGGGDWHMAYILLYKAKTVFI